MNVDDQEICSTSVQQERVRRVIDAAIDNGEDYVDLRYSSVACYLLRDADWIHLVTWD